MANFSNKKQTRPDAKTAPRYNDKCGKGGCTNNTSLAFMCVLNNKTGNYEVGCMSGHGKKPAYGFQSGNEVFMNAQFEFKSWITRCCSCYRDDLARHGKGVADYVNGIKKQAIELTDS